MTVAPEPYLSAFYWVLERAIVSCRYGNWEGTFSREHTADLMDAIHNIPSMIQNWQPHHLDFLRAALEDYEAKWVPNGGVELCQTFDDLIRVPNSPSEGP